MKILSIMLFKSLLFFTLASMTHSCKKVNPPDVDKQANGSLAIPNSNITKNPFNLADEVSTLELQGSILLWNDDVPHDVVTKMLEIAKFRRKVFAGDVTDKLGLIGPKLQEVELQQKIDNAENGYAAYAKSHIESLGKDWFENSLKQLPDTIATTADKTLMRHKFEKYCEAQLIDAASNFTYLMVNLYDRRPSPLIICEEVYSRLDLINPSTEMCSGAGQPKDYFKCMWLEGVVKTSIFKAMFSDEAQQAITSLVTTADASGKNLYDYFMDDKKNSRTGLHELFMSANGKLGCEDTGICAKPNIEFSHVRKQAEAIKTNFDRTIDLSTPKSILDNAFNPDFLSLNFKTKDPGKTEVVDYDDQGMPKFKSKKLQEQNRYVTRLLAQKTHIFPQVFQSDTIISLPEWTGGQNLLDMVTAVGSRDSTEISLSDIQINMVMAYAPELNARPALNLEGNSATKYNERKETIMRIDAKFFPVDDGKAARDQLKADLGVLMAQNIEKLTAINNRWGPELNKIVPDAVPVLIPENEHVYYTDSTLNITRRGSFYEFLFFFSTREGSPKHRICYSLETKQQASCPVYDKDDKKDSLTVNYDNDTGELILEAPNLVAEDFGLTYSERKQEEIDRGQEPNFNYLGAEKLNGKKMQLTMYLSNVGDAITIATGNFYIKNSETDKDIWEGSIDLTDYNQKIGYISNIGSKK